RSRRGPGDQPAQRARPDRGRDRAGPGLRPVGADRLRRGRQPHRRLLPVRHPDGRRLPGDRGQGPRVRRGRGPVQRPRHRRAADRPVRVHDRQRGRGRRGRQTNHSADARRTRAEVCRRRGPGMTATDFSPQRTLTIVPIDTPSLGDRSYLVHDGSVAFVVDPQRDIDRVLEVLDREGVSLTHVFETHIHNDYVTGGLALAKETGAAYLLNGADEVSFDREPLHDGQTLGVGDRIQVEVVATPGHTFTHLSYVLHDQDAGRR